MVKVCGLTRLEDVRTACDLGAWALGFVFAPSPRRLTPVAAKELVGSLAGGLGCGTISGQAPLTVGVFGAGSADEIAGIVEEVGLDAVQLHDPAGPGPAAVRMALSRRGRPELIIQAVPVARGATDAGSLREAVARAYDQADIVLLDTSGGTRFGGSGSAFPWALAAGVGSGCPLLIAGGITPENVQGALQESGAWGVDVSSGIERSPGVKDTESLRRLLVNAGAAAGALTEAPRPGRGLA